MAILTNAELQNLINKRDDVCVSIYMPTHKVGPGTQQDPIRLKNLLKKAEDLLVSEGSRYPEARTLLKSAYDLVADVRYWSYQDEGTAIFLSKDFSSVHRLPIKFDELVIVQDRFHIKPLLPLFSNDGQFFVLAVSQKNVRLFKAGRHKIEEIELDGVVKSIDETLKYDDIERQPIRHGKRSGPLGSRESGNMHGIGAEGEPKEDVLRFMRDVDRGLKNYLGQEKAPLVTACVEYLAPIYKSANTYPNLIDASVSGNPDGLSAQELHEEAWKIIEPIFLRKQDEAIAKYNELVGTGRTAKDISKVVEAAINGRVETLFVTLGVQRWGAYDPDTNEVEVHSERKPGDEDLLDLAAIHTFLNGGTVYALEAGDVPDDRNSAAILRY